MLSHHNLSNKNLFDVERRLQWDLYSEQTAEYDVYMIDGQSDIRRFFIMHIYEDFRRGDGRWAERSIGQLTVAQDGSMIIGSVCMYFLVIL